jgi:ornithine cyclodeaminase/alanine dehydrogenase-like protein (mu-crystallin family)
MRHLDADAVWQGLGMRGAIDALERAIGEDGFPPVPQRLHLREDDQQLLVMPSFTGGWAGVKLITIDPANPGRGLPLIHGSYTLFGPPALAPVATIDGAALTELRTAAVSGLATRYLARPDASRLVILGAGAQGRAHLVAMAAVRELSEVVIVAPRPASADAFLAFAADHLDGVAVRAGTPDDVADADLVCACTSSATPVFDGHRLPDRGARQRDRRLPAVDGGGRRGDGREQPRGGGDARGGVRGEGRPAAGGGGRGVVA